MKTATIPGDFGYTDEHGMVRQAARRLLGERCSMDLVRKRVAGGDLLDRALYRDLAELGWLGLAIPEAYGGAAMGWLALALVADELGRCVAPVPVLASVLAAAAIERGGGDDQKRRWLPAIAEGTLIATVAWSDTANSWEPDQLAARAEPRGDGWALSGTKTHVWWAADADLIVVPALAGADVALFVLERGAARVEPEVNVDPTRPTARVVLDGVTVPAAARLAGDGAAAWRDTFVRGWTLLAAESVGGAQHVLKVTRDYAVDRVQFARPIGSFQAVKHPLVNVMLACEQARSLVCAAAAALDTGEPADTLARMAKAAAADTYRFATDRGIQLHGGFGFTWDCDVHFYFKRALATAATLGDASHHRRHLADVMFG